MKSKFISAVHAVFQMGSLYARNLRAPHLGEVWKLIKGVYVNIVITVWSPKDLIFVHSETCVVNWVLLEHTGLCSLIYTCPWWRRSLCMCLLNRNSALSGEMVDSVGIVRHSSEEPADMVWQHWLLKEQVEGAVGDGNQWREKQKFQFCRNYLISWIKIREEGRDLFRILVKTWVFPDIFRPAVHWEHRSQGSRDVWGKGVGVAETGWIMSEVQRCRRVVSKRQELCSVSSLSFREVNMETKGKSQEGDRQKFKN